MFKCSDSVGSDVKCSDVAGVMFECSDSVGSDVKCSDVAGSDV